MNDRQNPTDSYQQVVIMALRVADEFLQLQLSVNRLQQYFQAITYALQKGSDFEDLSKEISEKVLESNQADGHLDDRES
ncbi:hypothetical protein EVAR_72742_1 [Eumeta japonica]|uniref:Uncharacterized protein n=1 Tax=Eumeta variegata TaxID=151549 RepID=A0A4C1SPJ5_EUMVA|nr:hypothetical protein EVAR_72742_1 [Eumeta japonica]